MFAGCGGGGNTTTVIVHKTVSAPTTSTAPTTTQSTSTTQPTSTGTTTSTTPTTSEAPTNFVHQSAFHSPTGNIGCVVASGVARCDVKQRTWSPPPRPPSCPSEVDFGQGLEVGKSGPGRFVCAGDTALDPTAPVLPYGTASEVGGFSCVSRSTGMTCTNRTSGHGFFISRIDDKTF